MESCSPPSTRTMQRTLATRGGEAGPGTAPKWQERGCGSQLPACDRRTPAGREGAVLVPARTPRYLKGRLRPSAKEIQRVGGRADGPALENGAVALQAGPAPSGRSSAVAMEPLPTLRAPAGPEDQTGIAELKLPGCTPKINGPELAQAKISPASRPSTAAPWRGRCGEKQPVPVAARRPPPPHEASLA